VNIYHLCHSRYLCIPGDGDCFYRCEQHDCYGLVRSFHLASATAFAFVEQALKSTDKELAAASALSLLESTIPMLEEVKYEAYVYEGFYEALVSVIRNVVQPEHGQILTPSSLLKKFQTPEGISIMTVFSLPSVSHQVTLHSRIKFHRRISEDVNSEHLGFHHLFVMGY